MAGSAAVGEDPASGGGGGSGGGFHTARVSLCRTGRARCPDLAAAAAVGMGETENVGTAAAAAAVVAAAAAVGDTGDWRSAGSGMTRERTRPPCAGPPSPPGGWS